MGKRGAVNALPPHIVLNFSAAISILPAVLATPVKWDLHNFYPPAHKIAVQSGIAAVPAVKPRWRPTARVNLGFGSGNSPRYSPTGPRTASGYIVPAEIENGRHPDSGGWCTPDPSAASPPASPLPGLILESERPNFAPSTPGSKPLLSVSIISLYGQRQWIVIQVPRRLAVKFIGVPGSFSGLPLPTNRVTK